MADVIESSLMQQQSAVVEQLLNEILDSVIAAAMANQVSAEGIRPAMGAVSSVSTTAGGTSPFGDVAATEPDREVQWCRSAVVPSQSLSSMSLLKEGVDQSCDGAFGLECLEAEGPAESWLVETADLQPTAAAASRIFCKGPSWDRFVATMAGESLTTPAATAAIAGQATIVELKNTAGEGVALYAGDPIYQQNVILTTSEQTQSAGLQGNSSKRLLAPVAEDAGTQVLAGQEADTVSQVPSLPYVASPEEVVCSTSSSRRSSFNGSSSPSCGSVSKATARPSSARISLRNSTDRLPSSGGLVRASSIDSKAAEQVPSGSGIGISRSSSISSKAAMVASPGANLRRSTGSLPLAVGRRSSSLKAAELRSSVDCLPFSAVGSSSKHGNLGGNTPLHTSNSDKLLSGASAHENEAWMASLRSVNRSSGGRGRAPAAADSQHRLTASSLTPARTSTAGRVTHGMSSNGSATPTTPTSRPSAAAKPARCASAKASVPATPPPNSKSTAAGNAVAGTPSSSSKTGSTPVSRGSSSKYSLRCSRPSTPLLTSNPTSPVMSPPCAASVAGPASCGAKSGAVSSPCWAYAGVSSTSANSSASSRKALQASPGAQGSFNQRHTVAAAGAASSTRPLSASIAVAHPNASCNLKGVKLGAIVTAAAAAAKLEQEAAAASTRRAAATTTAVAAAATHVAGQANGASDASSGRKTAGSLSPLILSPRSDEQKEQLWTSDAAAVQLFMDEYKEVLQAIDMALSNDNAASQVAGAGVRRAGDALAESQSLTAATAAAAAGRCQAEAAGGAATATAAVGGDPNCSTDKQQQLQQLDALEKKLESELGLRACSTGKHQQPQHFYVLEKKLEIELGLRFQSSCADADYTIAAGPAVSDSGSQGERVMQTESYSAGAKTAAAGTADAAVIAEVEVSAAVVDAAKYSQAGLISAAEDASAVECTEAAQEQRSSTDDVKVPLFGCFACFRRPRAKV